MKTQLLCTFTSKPRLNDTLDIIITCNDVLYEKVYVFQNENDLGQLICTYNIEYKYDYEESIIDTISLHRKKQSNTLYTINALKRSHQRKERRSIGQIIYGGLERVQQYIVINKRNGITKNPYQNLPNRRYNFLEKIKKTLDIVINYYYIIV